MERAVSLCAYIHKNRKSAVFFCCKCKGTLRKSVRSFYLIFIYLRLAVRVCMFLYLREPHALLFIPRKPGLIDTQPVPCFGRQPIHHFVTVFRHFCSSFRNTKDHPMQPFISSRIRLFISTAYSSGSSFETLSANPLTISARASSSLIPLDIR